MTFEQITTDTTDLDGPINEHLLIEPINGRLCCEWVVVGHGAFALVTASLFVLVNPDLRAASFPISLQVTKYDCVFNISHTGALTPVYAVTNLPIGNFLKDIEALSAISGANRAAPDSLLQLIMY